MQPVVRYSLHQRPNCIVFTAAILPAVLLPGLLPLLPVTDAALLPPPAWLPRSTDTAECWLLTDPARLVGRLLLTLPARLPLVPLGSFSPASSRVSAICTSDHTTNKNSISNSGGIYSCICITA